MIGVPPWAPALFARLLKKAVDSSTAFLFLIKKNTIAENYRENSALNINPSKIALATEVRSMNKKDGFNN
jgi:hypothetical protein